MSAENRLSEQDKIGKLIENEAKKRKQREEENEEAKKRTGPDGEIPRDARARADKMRIEEEKKKEKQKEFTNKSDTVSLIDPYPSDEIHRIMFQKYPGERAILFERERRHGKKSKPGWGRYSNLTRKKAGELMKKIIWRWSGANLPYTPEWVWQQILKDKEMGN